MKELYFDLSMGAAGDMFSAALLELCRDKDESLNQLNALGIPGIKYELIPAKYCTICGSKLKVSYYGGEEGHSENVCGHHHRNIKDISEIVEKLGLKEELKKEIIKVYRIIAQAEAKVHGSDMENIHFHELGTMDALADISAAVFLMDKLSPDRVSASPLCLGYGRVKCAHGLMPVPAPATALIVQGLPVYAGDIEKEMCTPTGAALVKHYVQNFGQLPEIRLEAVGYGMGSRVFEDRPNALRAMFGEREI